MLVYIRRAKTTGPYEKVPFAISASFMVALLEVYRDCFLPEDRTGRFFRYIRKGSCSVPPPSVGTLSCTYCI